MESRHSANLVPIGTHRRIARDYCGGSFTRARLGRTFRVGASGRCSAQRRRRRCAFLKLRVEEAAERALRFLLPCPRWVWQRARVPHSDAGGPVANALKPNRIASIGSALCRKPNQTRRAAVSTRTGASEYSHWCGAVHEQGYPQAVLCRRRLRAASSTHGHRAHAPYARRSHADSRGRLAGRSVGPYCTRVLSVVLRSTARLGLFRRMLCWWHTVLCCCCCAKRNVLVAAAALNVAAGASCAALADMHAPL